jgi:hypothetical protein
MLSDILVPAFAFITLIVAMKTGARLYMARLELKRGVAQPGSDSQRIERIEQIVETMAIEIERISEGQRFTTKLLADRKPDEMPMAHPRDSERVVTPH